MNRFFGHKEQGTIAEVTPQEVQQRLARNESLLLLDVREPPEYADAHIAGSTLIPLGQLSLRLNELPRDQPIVTVCRSGNRSGVAARLLARAGFPPVQNLRGGIVAWARGGLPLQRGR
jgi:rhodanese-related sulfurtransferase